MNKKLFKISLDIVMFVITLILLNINNTGYFIHALLGSLLGLLLTIHVILNLRWLTNVLKNINQVKQKTRWMAILDIIIMITYTLTIVLGVLISNDIYPFKMGSNIYLVVLHLLTGRISTVLMLIHVELHFDRMIRNKDIRLFIYIIYNVLVLYLAIYLTYTLIHSFQWMSLFM